MPGDGKVCPAPKGWAGAREGRVEAKFMERPLVELRLINGIAES